MGSILSQRPVTRKIRQRETKQLLLMFHDRNSRKKVVSSTFKASHSKTRSEETKWPRQWSTTRPAGTKQPHHCSSHSEDKAHRNKVVAASAFHDKANRNKLASSMFQEAGHSEDEASRNEAASSTFQLKAMRASLHCSCVPSPVLSNCFSLMSLTALWMSQLVSTRESIQSLTGTWKDAEVYLYVSTIIKFLFL